jgi:hypothetical protein
MSAISQVTTLVDLYTDLQNRIRLTTGVVASQTIATRYINIALQDIHLGTDFRLPWAERSATIRTQATYSTGTLSISQGSQTITGVGTAWNTNNVFTVPNMRVNGKIVISGSRVPYTISAVGGDTSATLAIPFTEAPVSGGGYVYFEDEYALASDFLRTVDLQYFSDQCNIDLIARTEFRRRYPNNVTPSHPEAACINDYAPSGNTTPIRRVRFAPAPSDFLTIPYAYITSQLVVSSTGTGQTGFVNDTDEPTMPLRYRHGLILHALQNWYRDRKDDARSQEVKAEYGEFMTRLAGDQESGSKRPQFRPRIQGYVRSARSPYGGGYGRRY